MDSWKVALCGGTHGNELTGIHLLSRWQQLPHEIERRHLAVETLLVNEAAYQANCRYIDNDLNRRFALDDLNNPALTSTEEQRAKVLNNLLGPKEDPRVDVGKIGWVTLRFAPDDALDEATLGRWIVESFRAVAPRSVSKKLDAS